MISRVYAAALACPVLDEVIVATDDTRIHHHLAEAGAKVEMTSALHPNGTERVAEVAARHPGFDCIVNIQGDEPCLHPRQITALVELMQSQADLLIGTLARRISPSERHELSNLHRVKAVIRPGSLLAYDFIRDMEGLDSRAWELGWHLGMYAFRQGILTELVGLSPSERELEQRLEQLRWLDNGYEIGIAYTEHESPAVDVPEDVARAEAFLRSRPE